MPTEAQTRYYRTLRKLNATQKREVRNLYNNTPFPQRPTIQTLAKQYQVSYNTMYRAIKSPSEPVD